MHAGEAPARAAGGMRYVHLACTAQCGVSAAGGGELEEECAEWLWQDNGLAAEPELHVLLAGVNMVEGQAADRGGPLGVEENEQAGDTVLGFEGVVVQQAARARCHRASVSMMPLGPSHLVAAKSRRVSFWRLAQRTKFPASP